MHLWQVLVLAVVQGITEFLPISSDGHLVALSALIMPGLDPERFMGLEMALHLGTLGSILVYYRREIVGLLGQDRRLIPLLIVATIPSVIVGLALRELMPDVLHNAFLAGLMLPVTGSLLLIAARFQKPDQTDYQRISLRQAMLIGLAQPFALLPGISRSGTTITAGLLTGLSPRAATTFSFLMAIPAIAGAGGYEVLKMYLKPSEDQLPALWLLMGAVLSFVVGLAAIQFLNRMLERNRLHWFAWWCIPLGIVVVIWQLAIGPPI
jgi:undecaprenyl-diphosphatase